MVTNEARLSVGLELKDTVDCHAANDSSMLRLLLNLTPSRLSTKQLYFGLYFRNSKTF